jgi:hypothetical protein
MTNNTDKTPYRSERWIGEEDISKTGESFIFDTISLISRGESLIECGIFKQDQNQLFMSAVIELLIITRSLLQRKKDLNAISSIDLVNLELIKYFRDGLCHTESWRSRGNTVKYRITYCRGNYDGSAPWINPSNEGSYIDKDLYMNSDDIRLFIGDRGLWIEKELVSIFHLTYNYFAENLPNDYASSVRCRKFRNSTKDQK